MTSDDTRRHDEFDDKAAGWDLDPAKVARAEMFAARIREELDLDPTKRLLEFGAGTGLVAERLADTVGPITLADRSTGMLEVLRSKATGGTLDGARVWDLDLERGEVPYERFDVLVTALVLHHLGDVDDALRGFARLLDDDGVVCIIDLDAEDGSFHGADFDGHTGFERATLSGLLEHAGFRDVRVVDAGDIEKNGRAFSAFMAIATRS